MRIYNDVFNATGMTDSASLNRALLTRPSRLSPIITNLLGPLEKNLTLQFLTEGMGAVESIDNYQFEWGVMNSLNKTLSLQSSVTNPMAGIRGGVITFTFNDSWFNPLYTIVGPSGKMYQIVEGPTANGSLFDYKVTLVTTNPEDCAPQMDLVSGANFSQMYRLAARDFSRGSTSNWVAPSLLRQNLATLRKGYSYAGDVRDQVIVFDVTGQQGGQKLWLDFEEYQHRLRWMQECENYYVYGVQTYDENGVVQMRDERGQPIIAGPGILEQIANKETYSELTENLINDIVGDLWFGLADGQNRQMTIMTGTGGMREFDKAMKNMLKSDTYRQFNDGKFVDGSGRNLALTGFFTRYEHVDGHSVTVIKNELFDRGPVAMASQKHPISGLPLESYRMVFLDRSSYDGKPNLQMLTKKGRENLRWAVAGSTIPRGFTGNDLRASDIDGCEVHFLKVGGVVLRRPNTSLDLRCTIS